MICRKCKKEIADNSKFCSFCGAKLDIVRKPKSRGNGQGSVYQLANKTWIAVRTIGYEQTPDGKLKRVTRSKSGFKTKKEAVLYLPKLEDTKRTKTATLKEIYDAWFPTHKAGKSTLNCYQAAMHYFAPVERLKIAEITIDDLQACMDECPKGKRTQQNMKALCGLLYKYAIPRNFVSLNMGPYLIVRVEDAIERDALPISALEKISQNIDTVSGADYVMCQCYLGFRPTEFLALDVEDYNPAERAFTGGAKTEAGINRVVTVSPKIQPIIDRLISGRESGPVFPAANGERLSIAAYRALFYAVLEKCGIENPIEGEGDASRHRYTPHSCRHTFATLMKRVQGADKDKLELIGHTSTAMLRHYQDVEFADLRTITDKI